MDELRQLLASLEEKLGLNAPLLARAQRRAKKRHAEAREFRRKQQAAQEKADLWRSEGHLLAASKKDKQALRYGTTADKRSAKAQWWVGRVKLLTQRIHGLEVKQEEVEAELKALNKVTVKGNKVTGGTARQRLRAALHTSALNCTTGKQRNYYSMTGLAPDHSHTIEGMPYGHRFDCSSYADGIYDCCGLTNPSQAPDGYTGTEGAHGKVVTRAQAKTGDLVLYGPYPHHHVEVVDDPKLGTTIGHGSAPIDRGIIDLFGDGGYIIRSYPL